MSQKIFIAPPTERQLAGVKSRLETSCLFIEHACALEGIPKKMIVEWIKLGRRGKPGFVEFTNMIDQTNADLANTLMTSVMEGVRNGDIKLAQWVYSQRISPYVNAFRKVEQTVEEEANELEQIEEGVSEEDIEAAEARALAALGQQH